jgi:hypothetical protein
MAGIIRSIPSLFLCLAALVLNAHMIIPHDHHIADSDVCQENRCPLPDSQTSQHKGLPLHCRAFNDLASEKPLTFVTIIKYIHNNDLVSGRNIDSDISTVKFSSIRLSDLPQQSLNPGILEQSSLRAPPYIS